MQKETLRGRAKHWLEQDPDPETRAELEKALSMDQELHERFEVPLRFGTAGIRAILGAGSSRINRVTVASIAHALGHATLELYADARGQGAVIAYDGRKNSRIFAEEAARVLSALGYKTWLSTKETPTPILAFAIRQLEAAVGIMVTASHNPPAYNGLKIFGRDGAQIISPYDKRIVELLKRAPEYALIPKRKTENARAEALIRDLPEDIEEAYFAKIQANTEAIKSGFNMALQSPLRVVYTAMSGVGYPYAKAALETLGNVELLSVPEEQDPDPSFARLPSPNPENSKALARALSLAQQEEADIVLANDPDADRLAAAYRDADGNMQVLSGNEIGCLMADHLLRQPGKPVHPVVLNTVVSTPILKDIAKSYGAHSEQTITGFKWIAKRGAELEKEGQSFVFGFEEAIGFLVGFDVRDKDGVSAAAHLTLLTQALRSEGKNLGDRLWELRTRYGYFASAQVTLPLDTLQVDTSSKQPRSPLAGMRSNPPSHFLDYKVEQTVDFLEKEGNLSTDLLAFSLEGGNRIMYRPSGTEPKLKIYIDIRLPVPPPSIPSKNNELRIKAKEEANNLLLALGEKAKGLLEASFGL